MYSQELTKKSLQGIWSSRTAYVKRRQNIYQKSCHLWCGRCITFLNSRLSDNGRFQGVMLILYSLSSKNTTQDLANKIHKLKKTKPSSRKNSSTITPTERTWSIEGVLSVLVVVLDYLFLSLTCRIHFTCVRNVSKLVWIFVRT